VKVEKISGERAACSACGLNPASKRLRVSEKFVSFPDLYSGGMLCEVCFRLVGDRRFRASHWLLLPDGTVKLLSKGELVEALRNPLPGSLVYVKSKGRKHGFLRALRFRSTATVAAVCGEDEGALLVPREKLKFFLELAEKAYAALKRKQALIEGCSASEWVHEEVCREIEEVRGDPLWRIVTRAI